MTTETEAVDIPFDLLGTKALTAPWDDVLASVTPLIGVRQNGDTIAHRVLLWGPKGTGKSTFPEKAMVREGKLLYRTQTTQDTIPADLVGMNGLAGMRTIHVDGPATDAALQGTGLCIDEIHRASTSVESGLHAILDDPGIARWRLVDRRDIRPRPGFFVVCTANLPPEVLPPALVDRFDIILHANRPCSGILNRFNSTERQLVLEWYRCNPVAKASADTVPEFTARRVMTYQRLLKALPENSDSRMLAARLVWDTLAAHALTLLGF